MLARTSTISLALLLLVPGCTDDGSPGTGSSTTGGGNVGDGLPCGLPGHVAAPQGGSSCDTCVCTSTGTWRCNELNVQQMQGTCDVIPVGFDASILLVVDDSHGTQDIQTTLATAASALTDPLDAAGIDYRIGVTNTSGDNPTCATKDDTAGLLISTSCRSRLDKFVTEIDPQEDHAAACTDVCGIDSVELLGIDIGDGATKVRPWLESRAGVTNVANASMAEALACLVPQGVQGCAFENPLEAMRTGFEQLGSSDAAEFQSTSARATILVTNELDCSHYSPEGNIFLPEGDRTFWSDPNAAGATSAVCWNAGVECEGGPGTYTDCIPVNLNAQGESSLPTNAVLLPVARYVDFWDDWEGIRQGTHPNAEVVAAGIVGVPSGYPGTPIPYADAADQAYQDEYGIGPACSGVGGEAIPAVRITGVLEELSDDAIISSVCDADYGPTLATVASRIVEQRPDGCIPYCVADTNPTVDGLQPECGFELQTTDAIPPCLGSPDAWTIPGGSDACYWYADPAPCQAKGLNVRVQFVTRPGAALSETAARFVCAESPDPGADCG